MERIFNLHKVENQWFWSWEREDGKVIKCRTDEEGCGIWQYLPSVYGTGEITPRQTAGTCDFMLRGMSISGARKKLKRYFIG